MVVHFETVSKIINHYNSKKKSMSFQYLLYLKLDSSEENVFWYSHIFIIFEAQISYLEHKGGYRNVIHIFNSQFDRVSINIDFSEKLKITLFFVATLFQDTVKSIPVSWKRVATKNINVIVLTTLYKTMLSASWY